jgi:tetratricopeptide (TPR) repeat protein
MDIIVKKRVSVLFALVILFGMLATTTTTTRSVLGFSPSYPSSIIIAMTTITTVPRQNITNNNATLNEVIMLNNKGLALANSGMYKESIVYFDKALAIDPKNIAVLYDKGTSLSHLGKLLEAVALFNKILAIDPKNRAALNGKEQAFTIFDENITG